MEAHTQTAVQPGLSEERLQEVEASCGDCQYLLSKHHSELLAEVRRLKRSVIVRDGVIADLKDQLTVEQNAHHTLQCRYNALFDAASEVTSAWTWNEPAPGDKITALSTLLNRQENEEDDQC